MSGPAQATAAGTGHDPLDYLVLRSSDAPTMLSSGAHRLPLAVVKVACWVHVREGRQVPRAPWDDVDAWLHRDFRGIEGGEGNEAAEPRTAETFARPLHDSMLT